MRGVSQGDVLDNIVIFLKNQGRDKKFTRDFNIGHCSAFSSVWLYSKWLSTQPNDLGVPRDDYEWFKNTTQLIADWDGKRELNDEDKAEFDRFISHIRFFQHVFDYTHFAHGELDQSLEDTVMGRARDKKEEPSRKLKKEYSITSLLTLEQLKKLLNTEGIIQDKKMVLVTSNLHDTAIFRDGDQYFYFDANSRTGEVEAGSLDEVAELIFNAHFIKEATGLPLDYSRPSPLGFRMFSFDEQPGDYPPVKEVLDSIDPTLDPVDRYADEVNGLSQAAFIGSLESVKYFLDKGIDAYQTNRYGISPANRAVLQGRLDILKEMFMRQKPIAVDGEKLLLNAIADDRLDVIDFFIESDIKVTSKHVLKAIDKGNHELAERLIKITDETNLAYYPYRFLSSVIKKGYLGIVDILLNRGVEAGFTDVLEAINNSYHKLAERLIRSMDEKELRSYSASFLDVVIKNGCMGVIDILLNKGIKVEFKYALKVMNKGNPKLAEKMIQSMGEGDLNFDARILLDSAIKEGNFGIAKQLFKKGANVNDAFIAAAKYGQIDIIRELLSSEEFKIDVNFQNSAGSTALMRGAEGGHFAVVKEILSLKGIDVNLQDSRGRNACMYAVVGGNPDVLKMILSIESIGDINYSNELGISALLLAVKGDRFDLTKILFEKGADIPSVIKYLFEYELYDKIIKLLDMEGIEGDFKNEQWSSVLVSAVWELSYLKKEDADEEDIGVLEIIIKNLIKKGVSFGNALIIAIEKGYFDVVKYILQLDIQEDDFVRVFEYVVNQGNLEGVELLLKNSKDVSEEGVRKMLEYSIPSGNIDVLDKIVNRYPDFKDKSTELVDSYFPTDLMKAIRNRDVSKVSALLTSGASIVAINKAGKDSLSIAKDLQRSGVSGADDILSLIELYKLIKFNTRGLGRYRSSKERLSDFMKIYKSISAENRSLVIQDLPLELLDSLKSGMRSFFAEGDLSFLDELKENELAYFLERYLSSSAVSIDDAALDATAIAAFLKTNSDEGSKKIVSQGLGSIVFKDEKKRRAMFGGIFVKKSKYQDMLVKINNGKQVVSLA